MDIPCFYHLSYYRISKSKRRSLSLEQSILNVCLVSIVLKSRRVYCLNIYYRNKRLQMAGYLNTKRKSTSRDLEQRYM